MSSTLICCIATVSCADGFSNIFVFPDYCARTETIAVLPFVEAADA